MIEENIYKCSLFDNMPQKDKQFWFEVKQKKFLHNIDTFYYSVKFKNDFRYITKDEPVLRLRKFFEHKYNYIRDHFDMDDFYIPQLGRSLV